MIPERARLAILQKRGYSPFKALDSGGQGNVYTTIKNNIKYAAKVVTVDDPKSLKLEPDLQRELSIMRNLKHPNCVRVEDMFRTKNKVYIIMDYMTNGDLDNYVRKKKGICEWNAKVWFCPIARAVKYLHDNRVAHRDIKLANMLLDSHFNPKLTDYGFSCFCTVDNNTKMPEKCGSFCGTPSYKPPEMNIKKKYDPFKADIWCLGICLFEMLNDVSPFDKQDKKQMYANQMRRNYRHRAKVDSEITNDLKDLIHKLLEPTFEKRISINDVCNHVWFPIDSRIAPKNI